MRIRRLNRVSNLTSQDSNLGNTQKMSHQWRYHLSGVIVRITNYDLGLRFKKETEQIVNQKSGNRKTASLVAQFG